MNETGRELYEIWAERASPWSAWAKPALFATYRDWPGAPQPLPALPQTPWAPRPDGQTALVVDLPDGDAVLTGLALAQAGFRPIPLFNGCAAPGMLVDVGGIATSLKAGAELLRRLRLDPGAPPAFLLDSQRNPASRRASPGRFDNRWVVFPQDLPSARALAASGVSALTLCAGELLADLSHVLMRYQEGRIGLTQVDPVSNQAVPLTVRRPSRFRELGYRAAVVVGLRRNPAGGFGARVPEPSSGG